MNPHAYPESRAAATAGCLLLVLLVPAAAWSQGTTACSSGSPAQPVEQFRTIAGQGTFEMWPPSLQPADPQGQALPAERDSTGYSGSELPGQFNGLELFNDLDIVESPSGTHLFMAYNAGFQIWDIGGANASNPQLLSQRDGWNGNFFSFQATPTEFYFLVWDIAALDPAGSPGDTLVALAADGPVGFSIWDASNKSSASQLYQNTGDTGEQVAVANIGGRSYAFVANTGGVTVYDMTRAREVGSCNESSSSTLCGGATDPVWRGSLTPWPFSGVSYLDVMTTQVGGQTKHFLAASGSRLGNYGVAIREITDAASLPPANTAIIEGLSPFTWGVDLFEIDGHYYLGVTHLSQLQVFEVTPCITSAPGCGYSDLRVDLPTLDYSAIPVFTFVQFSESNGRPFLYKGYHTLCDAPPVDGGVNPEYLLDLSGLPAGGEAVIVRGDHYLDPGHSTPDRVIDYWSSYYDGSTGGYSRFAPRSGRFHGSYFYRAGHTIFDVHQGQGETLRPEGPAEGFRDEAISFAATASGCTPSPTYTWAATGGGQVTGTGATVEITWDTAGSKTVTVSNSGCPVAGEGSAAIDIQAPEAMVGSVAVVPVAPVVCEPVAVTAQDVSGKIPITYDWEIRDGGGGVVASDFGTDLGTFDWPTGAGTPAGTYTAEVTVTNSVNAAGDTASAQFALGASPALTLPQPTYDGFPADPPGATVQFRVQTPGATEWSWNWGDGSPEQTFTSRAAGENPTHTFAVRETPYQVTVTVSNCLVPGGLESQPLSVTVNQALEVLQFRARCPFGACTFSVGNPVPFDQLFSGEPTLYEYDWDGNGSFEATSSSPVTTHTYGSPASGFRPQIRIRSGSAGPVSLTHEAALTVNPQATASLLVSGPTTLEVSQSGTYLASANNCSPTASGWTWTASGGGQIGGNTTTSQVSISWSTAGAKTVTARNASCGSVVGSRGVSVTEPPEILDADFDFSPSNPIAGVSVDFDGRGSTGSIVEYNWRFGDDNSRATGATTSHVFANAGSYAVTLEIISVPGCVTSACFDSVTKTVEITKSDRKLVLPHYAVGTGAFDGITTLFAVRNGTDTEVSVKYEYFSSEGVSLFSETAPLGPRAVRTVTLSAIEELIDPGSDLASGYLHISPQDPIPSTPALTGDFFRIDEFNNFASGDLLVSVPSVRRGEECQVWHLRYLNGGDFDGGTQFTFYVPENPGDGEPVVFGDVYDLAGNLVQMLSITDSAHTFEINSAELELIESFGAIEWSFREGLVGIISGTFKASGRFEVGLGGICQDVP